MISSPTIVKPISPTFSGTPRKCLLFPHEERKRIEIPEIHFLGLARPVLGVTPPHSPVQGNRTGAIPLLTTSDLL